MLSIDHFSLLCLLTEHTIILRYVTPFSLTYVPIFLTICCHCLLCSFLEGKRKVSIRNVCLTLHPITHLNMSSKRLPNSAPHYILKCVFETSVKFCSPLNNSMCLRNVCQALHPFTHFNLSPKRLPNSATHYTRQCVSETSTKLCTHYTLQCVSETSTKLCTPLHTSMCHRNVYQTLHPITHFNVSPKRLPNSAPLYTLQCVSETSAELCTPLQTSIFLRNVCQTLHPITYYNTPIFQPPPHN